MAGDHERYKRPDNEGSTKASALSRVFNSNAFFIIILLALGVLNYGWVIWPPLGMVWALLNGTIIMGIVLAGLCVKFYKLFRHSGK